MIKVDSVVNAVEGVCVVIIFTVGIVVPAIAEEKQVVQLAVAEEEGVV